MSVRKRRILFIAKNIPTPGRSENPIVIQLAERLTQFYSIHFLFPKEIVPWGLHLFAKYRFLYRLKSWKDRGFWFRVYPYLRLPLNNWAFLFLRQVHRSAHKLIDKEGPFDLIHAHFILPDGLIALKISESYHIPYVVTIRISDIKILNRSHRESHTWKVARSVIAGARAITVLNKASQEFISRHFERKAQLIPHGIEESMVVQAEPTSLSLPVRITAVANAIERKQIDWVIKAVQQYRGEKAIRLDVIGDGPCLPGWKKLAEEDARISFLGRMEHSEVLRQLESSHLFALPSYDETFGMVYLEAAAKYNAIIGRKGEGLWGILEPDKEALFAGDYPTFEKYLHQLIEEDDRRQQLASAALHRARELTWKNILPQYVQAYQKGRD